MKIDEKVSPNEIIFINYKEEQNTYCAKRLENSRDNHKRWE